MVNEPNNPLSQYFRGTSTFTGLPSCGFYNNPEDIVTSSDGEIEIFAMTTSDELLFKSPDALLNGESVAKVVQSCAPGIKNVYDLPMVDVEALLLAIRMATYGNQIDFSSECPECGHIQEFGVDIEWLLNNIVKLEPNAHVKLENKLVVNLRPYTYSSSVKAALLAFNESKFLQMLMEEELSDEEKAAKASASYKKAVELTMELLATSIVCVKDEKGNLITDDPKFIFEWLNKISRKDTVVIENKIKDLNSKGIPKEVEIECDKCQHVWKTGINVDPSHFFEPSS